MPALFIGGKMKAFKTIGLFLCFALLLCFSEEDDNNDY